MRQFHGITLMDIRINNVNFIQRNLAPKAESGKLSLVVNKKFSVALQTFHALLHLKIPNFLPNSVKSPKKIIIPVTNDISQPCYYIFYYVIYLPLFYTVDYSNPNHVVLRINNHILKPSLKPVMRHKRKEKM